MRNSALLRQERYARAAWSRVTEPGDQEVSCWLRALGPVHALAAAMAGDLREAARLRPRLEALDVERDLEVADRVGAAVVTPEDDQWPSGLADLASPPHCLWVRGPLSLADACLRSASVVGARSATHYGETAASEIAAGLSERGFTIVSGAAFGIDAAAHRGALSVQGDTIAVLAGGVERAYPAAHASLLSEIAEQGAVVSEVPPGSAPTRNRFLQRNRAIATLTRGTLVVEAGLRSGSLNTARHAREHRRVVACVPGPVTSMVSAGCHQAIRDGYAVLVTDAAEAADAFGTIGVDAAPRPSAPAGADADLTAPERSVLSALPVRTHAGVEELASLTTLAIPAVRAALGRLELRGLAERRRQGWRRAPQESPDGRST